MADEETQQEEQGQQQEQEERPVVSPLDPDFLLFALPIAILIDVLDWVVEIGTILDLVAGWTLIPWLMWRTGGSSGIQSKKRDALNKAPEQLAKQATRKALFRGILDFVLELIPIVNLFPWWTIQVVSTLFQKTATSQPSPQQNAVPSAQQNATIPQEA